ncbi:uncharacterized protein V1516DRAFT_609327, partial [Lipomyces oligophaga]|uniref:uncharacterized protein n=1 Tax=Lipomyces oligophaga TaxID=45792 RepID=UPI0034CFD06C
MASQTPFPSSKSSRSKRILISTHSFPKYHAPLSRHYSAVKSSSLASSSSQDSMKSASSSPSHSPYPATPSFDLYTSSSSEVRENLPHDIQTSLIQVGMKVRKSITEGYKLPATKLVYGDSTGSLARHSNSTPITSFETSRACQPSRSLKRGRQPLDEDSDESE